MNIFAIFVVGLVLSAGALVVVLAGLARYLPDDEKEKYGIKL